LNSLIKEEDDNDELYWQRSIIHQKLEQPAESLSDIKKAIKLNNEKYHYYKTLAQAYLLNKNYDSAIVAAYFSRDAGNNDYQLQLILAEAHLKKGQVKQSMAEISEALKIDPNYSYTYYLRGLAYNNLKDSSQAFADFSRAMALNPNDKNVYDELLEYHLIRHQMNDARLLLDKMFNVFEPEAEMFLQKGKYYELQNKADSAYVAYLNAVELDSSLYETSLKMGNIKLKNKEFYGAIDHYESVLRIKNDNFEAQYKMATAYEAIKDYSQALTEFQKSFALDSLNQVVRVDIERVNARIKRIAELAELKKLREQQRRVILLPEIPKTPVQ
jgi:tetratricopeptide (TPR) repeat protein